MFCLTCKVLALRYVYTIRQRWLLPACYLSIPLILCAVTVGVYQAEDLRTCSVSVKDHDEQSLLQTVRFGDDGGSWPNYPVNTTRRLKIIVCPDGTKERQLMETVEAVWRQSDSAADLEISFVNNPDVFEHELAIQGRGQDEESVPKGLHFLEISGSNLTYKIRPKVRYGFAGSFDWWDFAPSRLFPSPMLRGPRTTDPYFNTITRYTSRDDIQVYDGILDGFLPLQVAVDKAYIVTYFSNDSYQWLITSFPHPPYKEVPFDLAMAPNGLNHRDFLVFIQYILMMGNLLMISAFASYTISDKVSGILELLCLNGADRWLVNLSWLVSFSLEAAVLVILEVALLTIPMPNGPTIYMSAPVLLLVLLIHNWLVLCWVQVLSTLIKQKMCIFIVIAYWMFSPAFNWICPDKFVMQGVLAALPNAGLVLIFMSYQEFDGAQTKLGLGGLATHPLHYLPVGTLLVIMFATMLLLILLGIYLDLVMPGPYGRAKPWYICGSKSKSQDAASSKGVPQKGKHFESFSSQDAIGLECRGVSKIFRTSMVPYDYVIAVGSVSVKIPKNKITTLLGPNGAGKTTLFSILSGMYSPTVGSCYTQGYNVFEDSNMKKFRKVLGYCPQNNLLMSALTVKQHLIIFGLLKGLTTEEASSNSQNLCERLDMAEIENEPVKLLSSGTKRKLCLAIAMTGEPEYLLLDQPSAGLDIKTRRIFWNVLLQEKNKRTIFMSTHDMDEADVLADRVAVMLSGHGLVGWGSSSFLKKQVDTGYKVTCSFLQRDRVRVLAFAQQFHRSILILYETRNTVTLGFPQNIKKMATDFVKSLKSEFGNDVGASVSQASLDDVFARLSSQRPSNSQNNVDLENDENDIDKSCRCGQVTAIFNKKIAWFFNQSSITAIFLLLICPIFGALLTLNFLRTSRPSNYQPADLRLSIYAYRGKTAYINWNDTDPLNNALVMILGSAEIEVRKVRSDVFATLAEQATRNLFEYRSQVVFAFESLNQRYGIPTAYFSRNAFHSAPIAYSTLLNALLYTLNPNAPATITTHNVPYSTDISKSDCSYLGPSPRRARITSLVFAVFLGGGFLLAGAYFIILPQIERRSLFKHLQLTTGLQPWVYWTSHLVLDLVLYSISMLIVIIIMATTASLFSNVRIIVALILVFLLYGISTILLAYAFSFSRCSLSVTVTWFVFIPPLLTSFFYYLTAGLLMDSTDYMIFLPWAILIKSLMTIYQISSEEKYCNGTVPTEILVVSLAPYLLWFLSHSVVYLTFIIAMDHGFGRRLRAMFVPIPSDMEATKDVDPDVAGEKERVRFLVENDVETELICNGLWKRYGCSNEIAVRDVTFAVGKGNIFGLLGANGSGKTTTLSILAGVLSPTLGSLVIRSQWDQTDCEYKYIKNIGYCPQEGGLLHGLTGRNTLRLFARLRGLKPSIQNPHVDRWMQALNLEPIADQQCQMYSTGDRRKLSFAIAMMGRPSVVLLDEPTSHINPSTRRRIWGIFGKDARRVVILKSHTMSEIEAVCDRVTFMDNGKMNRLGSLTELKSKLGKSSTLLIKLKDDVTLEQMEDVLQKILEKSRFARYAKIREKQPNALSVAVKLEEINAQEVIAEMTNIKDANSSIEDFTLTESLDDVFMMFFEKLDTEEGKQRQDGDQKEDGEQKKREDNRGRKKILPFRNIPRRGPRTRPPPPKAKKQR